MRERTAWALLAAACAAAFALDQGSGGTYCFRDIPYYFLPQAEACRQAVAGGEVPLWNPFVNCGQPLLATWQCAAASPLSLPLLTLPWALAIRVYWLLAFVAAAGGMFALALRAGLPPAGAAVAAVLYSGGGPMRTIVEWPPIVSSMAFLPALLAVLVDLTRGARGAAIAAGLLGSLQLLSGQPRQLVVACLASALLLAAFRPPRAGWGRIGLKLMAAAALAAAVASLQMLPVVELFRLSERSAHGVPPSVVAESFLTVKDLLTAVAAGLWGGENNPLAGGRLLVPRLYIGFAGLWLAAAAARTRRPAVYFGLAAVLTGLVLSLGEQFYRALTLLLADSYPLRYMGHLVLLSFLGACLLAGVGAARLMERPPGAPFFPALALVTALAVLSPAGSALVTALGWPVDSMFRAPGLLKLRSGVAVSAAIIIAVWWLTRLRGRAAAAGRFAVPVLLASDLLVSFHGYHLRAGPDFFARPSYLSRTGLRDGRIFAPTSGEPVYPNSARVTMRERYRARWRVTSPNLPQLWGIRNAYGYEPFRPEAARTLFGEWEDEKESPDAALHAAGVGWAVTSPSKSRPHWRKIEDIVNGWAFWEVPNPAPLASILPSAARPASWRELEGIAMRGKATMQEEGWNGIRVEADSPEGGLLCLRVTGFPGWRAEEDGRRIPVVRIGGVFMGTPVPPGRSSVRLSYAPLSFSLGLLLSFLAVSVVLVAGLYALLRLRPQKYR